MVSLKTGSPQRWRNGWFENLNIECTFCSNSGGPWLRPLSAPGRGVYPHFHLYEAPTALVPPFATMSRTRGLQKANVVSRSWVCCFSRHNLWFLVYNYFLWASAEGVEHTQRAEILRVFLERQLTATLRILLPQSVINYLTKTNKQLFGVQKYHW